MTTLFPDLRHALRAMAKQPLFAGVGVLTLGLGIGANTAIFSVVHAVLLEPVPYPAKEPERVLFLTEKDSDEPEIGIAYPSFKDWQRLNRSFETVAGFRDVSFNLTGLDEPLRLEVTQVSHGYFEIQGVAAILGRFPAEDEDRPGAERVLVLNHSLWRARFGGDPDVLGTVVELDEEPYTVIGVLPADFEISTLERAFTPLEPWAADSEDARARGNHEGLHALGRLRDGVSLEEARAEMETIAQQLESQYPATNSGVGVTVKRLGDRRVEDYRRALLTLLGAVSLVLLIACANVANLFLARAVSRKRVLAIQSALGASRLRLVRQGLTEGVVMAVLGGALGTLLAFWCLSLLRGLLPADVPRLETVEIDAAVLFYTLGLSGLTGVLFGAAPSWLASRTRPGDSMKEGGRDTGGGAAGRWLLVTEVALATLLLIGATLVIRSVHELTRVDPGFRPDGLLTMRVGVPYSRYEGEARNAFLRRLDERLEALPAVSSATVGLTLPMMGARWISIFIVRDQPVPKRADLPSSLFTPVEPGYFETLGIPLVRGRLFEAGDDFDAPSVVVVNEALARHFWPGQDPIGKRLKQGWPENEGEYHPWREIVGVVGDVKQFGLGEDTRMQTYIPLAQSSAWSVHVAVRTATDPLSLLGPVKHALSELDASLPVYYVQTMESVIRESIAPRRFSMVLLGIFAGLATLLAAVGLYGVVAYSVARRVREIGLRMSVGADRIAVFRLVVSQGMGWAVLGAALGLLVAAGASQLLSSLLYGVSARDPLTFIAVPTVLLVVAFAASAAPALAASRIDPIRALRYE